MTGFNVSLGELQAVESFIAGLRVELDGALGSLRSDVEVLLGEQWSGAAADAFRAGFQQWQQGAADVLDALESIGAALSATGMSYEDADAASVQTLAQIARAL